MYHGCPTLGVPRPAITNRTCSMSTTVFLGTFTGGPGNGMASHHGPSKSEGIYSAKFDPNTGVRAATCEHSATSLATR